MSERFGWVRGDRLRVSQCVFCRHAYTSGPTCAAYPDGIPDEILLNRHDHRNAYAGDGGVQFEPDPGQRSPFEEAE